MPVLWVQLHFGSTGGTLLTRTMPPVVLTCSTLASARLSLLRVAQNALAVALLASRNAPRPGAHAQAPNGGSRVSTPGGSEVQTLAGIDKRLEEAYNRQAMTEPDTEARAAADKALDRLESHRASIQAQLDALTVSAPVRPGLRDTYTVIIPALHVRVEGVEYVSDLTRLKVEVDPQTPNYDRYLGRGEWPGHQAEGKWPLYLPRGNKAGMQLAQGAESWHVELIESIWAGRSLPELRQSMVIQAEEAQ